MKTIINLADDYISEQRRLYKRDLQSYTRSYIKGFARYLESKMHTLSYNTLQTTTRKETDNIRKTGAKKVAVITEEIGSMTGGRYYAWFIAIALTELGYDVTLYTNQTPSYIDFFRNYKQPKLQLVDKHDIDSLDIEADMYISSPLLGNVAVTKLWEKYKKPCFVMVFDPLPMMKEFTTPYTGWEESIKRISATNVNILTLCNSTSPYVYDWLNKKEDQVFAVYPCINSRELNLIPETKREDYVVFISRLVRHKKFEDVLHAVKKADVKLKVISSVKGASAVNMLRTLKLEDKVEFLIGINDQEKFEVLSKARAVINASNFEGFGMWAAEGVATGTPVVAYDIPPIHEIMDFSQADNFYLAKFNDVTDLGDKLQLALKEKKFHKRSHIFDFESMQKRLKDLFNYEPRVGVITIALNEEEFIASSLASVIKHPHIKRVAVVEGAVKLFSHACTEEGLSIDKTQEQVYKASKLKNGQKIIYSRYGWAKDKSELRNHALYLLGDVDYVLVVDADEVWSTEDLDKLIQGIKDNPDASILRFKFHHFWKKINQVAVGGQWNSMMFRCFKYLDKSLHWDRHETAVVNGEGTLLSDSGKTSVIDDVFVYHLGYMKKEKNVQDKLEYYKKRDTQLNVKDTFTHWKKGDPTSPTHGGGDVEPYKGKYPEEINLLIKHKLL